jgi:hypothetical protein
MLSKEIIRMLDVDKIDPSLFEFEEIDVIVDEPCELSLNSSR